MLNRVGNGPTRPERARNRYEAPAIVAAMDLAGQKLKR